MCSTRTSISAVPREGLQYQESHIRSMRRVCSTRKDCAVLGDSILQYQRRVRCTRRVTSQYEERF